MKFKIKHPIASVLYLFAFFVLVGILQNIIYLVKSDNLKFGEVILSLAFSPIIWLCVLSIVLMFMIVKTYYLSKNLKKRCDNFDIDIKRINILEQKIRELEKNQQKIE